MRTWGAAAATAVGSSWVGAAAAAPRTSSPAATLGGDSIGTFWLEFWLEKRLLEISYTKKMFKNG